MKSAGPYPYPLTLSFTATDLIPEPFTSPEYLINMVLCFWLGKDYFRKGVSRNLPNIETINVIISDFGMREKASCT